MSLDSLNLYSQGGITSGPGEYFERFNLLVTFQVHHGR